MHESRARIRLSYGIELNVSEGATVGQKREDSPIARQEIVEKKVTDAHEGCTGCGERAVLVDRLLLCSPSDGSVGGDEGHANLSSSEVPFGDLKAVQGQLGRRGVDRRAYLNHKGVLVHRREEQLGRRQGRSCGRGR